MTTLDKIKAEIQKGLDAEGDSENARAQALALFWVLELIDKYAEQEPCTDAVSRQAVLKQLKGCLTGGETEYQYVKLHIDSLPPVRPQETVTEFADRCRECGAKYGKLLKQATKTGKWEEIVKEHKCYARDDTYTTTEYHCSECGAEPFENEDGFYELSNYCPNCGCRMIEQ